MARIPDPNAFRRDRKDDVSWTVLIPGQKVDQVPAWPLPGQSVREEELWALYWAKPQAILWLRNSQEIEVALYVRRLSEVEVSGATASLHTLLMRQMSSLLLTIPAMYQARVKIGGDENKSRRKDSTKSDDSTSSVISMRDRIKLLNNLETPKPNKSKDVSAKA